MEEDADDAEYTEHAEEKVSHDKKDAAKTETAAKVENKKETK